MVSGENKLKQDGAQGQGISIEETCPPSYGPGQVSNSLSKTIPISKENLQDEVFNELKTFFFKVGFIEGAWTYYPELKSRVRCSMNCTTQAPFKTIFNCVINLDPAPYQVWELPSFAGKPG